MDTWAFFSIGLVLGVVVGTVLVLVVRRAAPDASTAEARRLGAELEAARTEAGRAVGLAERLDAERRSFARELDTARRGADERLDLARAQYEENLAKVQNDNERLEERFSALSRRVLAETSEHFLAQAEERFRRSHEAGSAELAKREQAVRALVEPISRAVTDVRREVTEAERARLASQGVLSEQVRAMTEASTRLRDETGQLVTALRSSQVRGAWGELQLRRVVEAAGMLDHVDFDEQEHVVTDDGALRPDMVVHLAGGKNVVVDSKVAFLGYLDAQQTADPAVRADRLAAHARHLRKHVDDLAGKRYWDQFSPAPEFVVMFVPAEAFLSAALDEDPSLMEYAMRSNVVVATPMTLLALLRTVAYTWRQESLAKNAQKVLDVGKQLHGRLATMGTHLDRLGRQITGTANAYNTVVGSLETRVLVSARRFAELGVADSELPELETVNPPVSLLRAPELLASAEDSVRSLADRALGLPDRDDVQDPALPPGEPDAGEDDASESA